MAQSHGAIVAKIVAEYTKSGPIYMARNVDIPGYRFVGTYQKLVQKLYMVHCVDYCDSDDDSNWIEMLSSYLLFMTYIFSRIDPNTCEVIDMSVDEFVGMLDDL
jgi:hypothetical protein